MSRFNSLIPAKAVEHLREGLSLRKAVTLIASVSLLTTMAVAVPNAATAAPPTTWSITSSTAGSGSGTVSSQSGLQLLRTSADIFFGPDSGSMVSAISIDGVDLSGADLSSAVGAGSFTVAQGTAPNYNRTVVVTFNLITYTVHFDNQGHGTPPSDATGVITLAFASLPSESTDGDYSFSGWSTDAAGNVMVTADYTPGADSTLYAIWNYNPPTDNTVVFDGNGATFGSMHDEVNSNLANLDLNMFARSGYTFAGWNTDSRGGSYGTAYEDGGSFDFSAGGATLYAQWTPNQTYIVTYASGGAVGTPPTQSDISEGASFNLASASGLTMADYYFTGWSDGPSVFNAGDSYTMPASDVVLTATWASDIGSCSSGYTVTYIGNESTGGSTPVDSTCYPLNAEVTLALNTFTRTGFTFDSWNLLTNGQGIGWAETGTFYISQNTVIYAIWHAAAYTVSFDNQGHGSAVGDATNVSTIALASLPSESTDGYYIFLGWSESVGGSVLTGDYTPTQNSTLYAVWFDTTTSEDLLAANAVISNIDLGNWSAARSGYEALTTLQKTLVSNYPTLLAHESDVAAAAAYQLELDGYAAAAIIDEINNQFWAAARSDYDVANAQVQSLVTNYNVLLAHEAEVAAAAAAAQLAADRVIAANDQAAYVAAGGSIEDAVYLANVNAALGSDDAALQQANISLELATEVLLNRPVTYTVTYDANRIGSRGNVPVDSFGPY